MMMQLVSKILACLAILCATILFVGIYNIGHMHLKELIEPFAIGPIIIFMLGTITHLFLGGNKDGSTETE